MTFNNGDIYDIGQTINGISKFIYINGKWHYYSIENMAEYQYNQNELTYSIQDEFTHGNDVKFLGNIFIQYP
jgi:hypothetical protein